MAEILLYSTAVKFLLRRQASGSFSYTLLLLILLYINSALESPPIRHKLQTKQGGHD